MEKDGVYGTDLEFRALCKIYDFNLVVHQAHDWETVNLFLSDGFTHL
jgi:hypothetical protein